MLIFGHPWVDSPKFRKIFAIEEISHAEADEIILLEPLSDSIVLARYCQSNQRHFAVTVNSVTEALFANALGSRYVVCQIEDAPNIQPIAQEYLFDTKILALISSEKEIAKMAALSVDGVIFPRAILVG